MFDEDKQKMNFKKNKNKGFDIKKKILKSQLMFKLKYIMKEDKKSIRNLSNINLKLKIYKEKLKNNIGKQSICSK